MKTGDIIVEDICLAKDIVDVFKAYGGVERCVNRILDMASEGQFDMMNKPPITMKEQCRRYKITIRNQDYIDLRKLYPGNSSKISLRRLCEWFVTNEFYTCWVPEKPYQSYGKFQMALINTINAVTDLQELSCGRNAEEINSLISILQYLYEVNIDGKRQRTD